MKKRSVDAGGLELPQPDGVAIEQSSRLVASIVARIDASGGSIRFDEYMQMALYEPTLGYYSGAAVKFGLNGDFVTAPEISPLFGYCLAHQSRELIQQGCGASILEFGAGSGKLAATVIEALPELERYLILDLSAELNQRQRSLLSARLSPRQFAKVDWLTAMPEAFDGIVIANEVFDAMPVHLLVNSDSWRELGVSFDGRRFCWCDLCPTEPVLKAMRSIEKRLGGLPRNYRCELNLNYRPWFAALNTHCTRAVVLIVDYGYEQAQYYHSERRSGTLQCHFRHRVHGDPLIYPGLQDITAFVDFDAMADAAEEVGFGAIGLVSQDHFLRQNGLLEEARRLLSTAETKQQFAITQQLKTLCLPSEMGQRFKVLALQKNLAVEMPSMRRGSAHG